MNLRHAECVLSILEAGSITAAAKAMYVSQSALSQTLQRAEKALGAEIFRRDTEPISLTFSGQKYVNAVQRIMAIAGSLQNEINEINHEVQGVMRLGISLQRGAQLLPGVLPAFVRGYPKVRLQLIEQGSATLERYLHDGACDLALITTVPSYDDLVYDLLETEEVMLVVPKGHRLSAKYQDGASIDIDEVALERFVALKHGHSVRQAQEDLFRRSRVHPELLLETDSLEAAKRIAASGAALMFCPNVYVEQTPEVRQRVKCLRIKGMGYRRHFYLAYRKDMYLPRFMRDFAAIVKDHLRSGRETA